MGIGVQGEAGGEVAEDTGHGFNVHAVLQGDGERWERRRRREERPERVAAVEKIEGKRKPDDFFGHRNRKTIFAIGFRLLLFQNFYRLG